MHHIGRLIPRLTTNKDSFAYPNRVSPVRSALFKLLNNTNSRRPEKRNHESREFHKIVGALAKH